jgi:hypothetical protein
MLNLAPVSPWSTRKSRQITCPNRAKDGLFLERPRYSTQSTTCDARDALTGWSVIPRSSDMLVVKSFTAVVPLVSLVELIPITPLVSLILSIVIRAGVSSAGVSSAGVSCAGVILYFHVSLFRLLLLRFAILNGLLLRLGFLWHFGLGFFS